MRKKYFVSLAVSLLLATSGLALTGPPPAADEDFVMQAAKAGKIEVELGQLAAKKGLSAAVKSFGRRMVTDHTAAGNKLKLLAAKKNIVLPSEMDSEGRDALQRLSALSGKEFDRAYMEMMVSDHEKAVSDFQTEANTGAEAEVKAFAAKTLPTLKLHLQLARTTAAKVK
jgi:putative membrane protein